MSGRDPRYSLQAPGAVTIRAVRQSDEKHCFSCGQIVHASATSCPFCGAVQAAGQMTARSGTIQVPNMANAIFCYGCGNQMHAAAPACPTCGAPQRTAQARGTKDRTTAIVLAFLLGGIGGHKFYLGSPGWGILYFLFSWTFVPAFVSMVEGLIYLSKSDEDFARTYR